MPNLLINYKLGFRQYTILLKNYFNMGMQTRFLYYNIHIPLQIKHQHNIHVGYIHGINTKNSITIS